VEINIHLCYFSQFFLQWDVLQENCSGIRTYILCCITFFKNHAVYEMMWKNMVLQGDVLYHTGGSGQPNQYRDSRAGRSGDRIPVGARFFAPIQTGPGAHPASYTMGTGSFPWVKRPGRGVDHPSSSSTEVKERVQLYIYSPFGPSQPVVGWNLPLPLLSLPDDVVRRMRFVCSINKATNTQWEYVILKPFHAKLRERTSVLRLHKHCLPCFFLMEAHFVLCENKLKLYVQCPTEGRKVL
jgi:hypothetical protein